MTSAAIAINPVELQSDWADRAMSSDAQELRGLLKLVGTADTSLASRKKRWELENVCSEASEPNWDGYGAPPVSYLTYSVAKAFLETLPHIPIDPDIAIDPDGEVSFAWHKAPRQLFTVSVGRTGRLSYAGIFGDVNTYGTEYFNDQVPSPITTGLARLFPVWR